MRRHRIIKPLVIGLFWLIVWQLIALIIDEELFVPSPLSVIKALSGLITKTESLIIIFKSVIRVALGMFFATIIGGITAFITTKFKVLNDLLSPIVSIIKATPVASFIILALIWLGAEKLPILICTLMALPLIWVSVSDGIHAVSKEDLAVSKIFRFSRIKTLRLIYVPTIAPYFVSASRTAIGLAWKAGVAAEVIAHTPFSIGKSLSNARLYYEIPEAFAWTLIVVVLSMLIELVYSKFILFISKKLFYVREYAKN